MEFADSSNNNYDNFLLRISSLVVYISHLYDNRPLLLSGYFHFLPTFVILILVLISINICRKKALLRRLNRQNKTHAKGWRILFEPLFQSWRPSSTFGSRRRCDSLVKYYCMSCDKENNGIACSKCGSKMKRAH